MSARLNEFYADQARARRATPRTIQAVPLPSAEPRRPVWPSLIVGGFVLGIAVLEGLIPALIAWLP